MQGRAYIKGSGCMRARWPNRSQAGGSDMVGGQAQGDRWDHVGKGT